MISLVWFKEWLKQVKIHYGDTWSDIHTAMKDKYKFDSYKSTHTKIKGDIFEYSNIF